MPSNEIKWNLDRREGLDCSRPPWKWPQSMIYSSSNFLTQTVKHLRDNSNFEFRSYSTSSNCNEHELNEVNRLKSSYWNVVDWIVADWILADSPTICMIDLFGFVNRSNALKCSPMLSFARQISLHRLITSFPEFKYIPKDNRRSMIETQRSKFKEDRKMIDTVLCPWTSRVSSSSNIFSDNRHRSRSADASLQNSSLSNWGSQLLPRNRCPEHEAVFTFLYNVETEM